MISAVLDQFGLVFGPEARLSVADPDVASWGAHPFVGGAWAYPVPGALTARADLSTPVDGRLYFAGEATSQRAAGTAHGAYQSGLVASELVAESLGISVGLPARGDNHPV
jgi:monoamine oxidase